MNREARGFLIGMLLGDSCIYKINRKDRENVGYRLSTVHSVKQAEYSKWKAVRLQSLMGGGLPTVHADKTIIDGKTYPMVRWVKQDEYFKQLYGWMYIDSKFVVPRQVLEWLTTEGMAVWYMDDGSARWQARTDGSVHACSILWGMPNKAVAEVSAAWLIERHRVFAKLSPVQRGRNWALHMDTPNSNKFFSIIRHHVHNSMSYKVEHRVSGHEPPAPVKVMR